MQLLQYMFLVATYLSSAFVKKFFLSCSYLETFLLLATIKYIRHKLLRQNKSFLTSVSIYLVSAAASAWELVALGINYNLCKLVTQIWLYSYTVFA